MVVRSLPPKVPRTPEDPGPHEVYQAMVPGDPYTVMELAREFDNASRRTIRRRLNTLVEEGFVDRKQHSQGRVSYWVPED